MSVLDVSNFSFDSEFQGEAYARWFLRLPFDLISDEFTEEEWTSFLKRRELKLKAELDELLELNFNSPHACHLQIPIFKIAKAVYKNPISGEGASTKPSRFNYKNIPEMQNRVIYLERRCF